MALSMCLTVVQAAVKRLTDVNSALTTLQASMILLFLWQLSALAWAIPYFKLFIGTLCHSLLPSGHNLPDSFILHQSCYVIFITCLLIDHCSTFLNQRLTKHITCAAEASSQALDTLGNSMMMAGVVGVPVFFILMLTIGTSQDTFSDVGSIVEQVASYQFVGVF
jgi:hypothetical protein